MPYRYCKQCKKRISNLTINNFCSDECERIYTFSSDIFCENCKKLIGKESVLKNQRFCNNVCHNEYQKKINVVERECIWCHKKFSVKKSSHRYKLCSDECEKSYIASRVRNDRRMKTLEENNLNKYGVKSVLNLKEVRNKISQTMISRYGDISYNNFSQIRQTKLERHGDPNFNNTEKIKKTKLEKYGKLSFNEKANQTKLEKYGTLNFTGKANQTKIQKYGSLSKVMLPSRYDILQKKYENNVEFMFSKNEYIGSGGYQKYNFKCKKCHNIFLGTMTNGIIPRCTFCYPIKTINFNPSSSEIEIVNFIKSIYTKPIWEQKTGILSGKKQLDIYLPENKIAIEYDGIYWHGECNGGKTPDYHLRKTEECETLGIHLLHIFETDWHGKKTIVKNKLRHLLHVRETSDVVYARNCSIGCISSDEKNRFLNEHHLQGQDNSSIRLGAFYKNELVAVMTFGKLRIALGSSSIKPNEYEMYRFCIGDKNVVGIAGKLFSYFIKTYHPSKVITYADRRYSNLSAFYTKIGFRLNGITKPNYWYFEPHQLKLYHRFNFRKSELTKKLQTFDPALTEWQNMQLNGYDRIWDCGHYKFVWECNSI